MRKILIACYFFPPYPSIGGRRAAKFAKYLAQGDYEISVIHAENPFKKKSSWFDDIIGVANIKCYALPLYYPKEFIDPPTSLVGKIKYRISNLSFLAFHNKKNKYDYTIFWEKIFLEKCRILIEKHKIRNLLISCPPFYYAFFAVKLKGEFKDLNIIIDFRDPWINSPYYMAGKLNAMQTEYELSLIRKVFKDANYIIGPNSFLLNEQWEHIGSPAGGAALLEIPHGYDADEIPTIIKTQYSTGEKIKMVYGGQLYPGLLNFLSRLNYFLDCLEVANVQLYNNLEIKFYTPELKYENIFRKHKNVHFYEPIGNKIMDVVNDAHICLLFLADHNKDYQTTKFLEYAAVRKPFMYFGPKGYVSDFIVRNNIGSILLEDEFSDFHKFLENFEDYMRNSFNNDLDLTEYSFDAITRKLAEILI